jgi:hypothetical protein
MQYLVPPIAHAFGAYNNLRKKETKLREIDIGSHHTRWDGKHRAIGTTDAIREYPPLMTGLALASFQQQPRSNSAAESLRQFRGLPSPWHQLEARDLEEPFPR